MDLILKDLLIHQNLNHNLYQNHDQKQVVNLLNQRIYLNLILKDLLNLKNLNLYLNQNHNKKQVVNLLMNQSLQKTTLKNLIDLNQNNKNLNLVQDQDQRDQVIDHEDQVLDHPDKEAKMIMRVVVNHLSKVETIVQTKKIARMNKIVINIKKPA